MLSRRPETLLPPDPVEISDRLPRAAVVIDTACPKESATYSSALRWDSGTAHPQSRSWNWLKSSGRQSLSRDSSAGGEPAAASNARHASASRRRCSQARLSRFVSATEIDPLLILPAGGNALDAADMAQAFADIGAKRMIVTRLDVARRLGCLLAAADQCRLAFSGVSITPRVAKGLNGITAATLARLIMPQEAGKAMETSEHHVEQTRQPGNVGAPGLAAAV